MEDLEQNFVEHLKHRGKIGFTYVKIEDSDSFEKIYYLFLFNRQFEPRTGIEFLYYGVYHRGFKVDNDLAEKYYLLAVEKGNNIAMCNLAKLKYERDDNEAHEKYMCMAAETGYLDAIESISRLYRARQKFDLCIKYLLIGVEKNDLNSMLDLGSIYERYKPDYKLMKLYYLKAYTIGKSISGLYGLIMYYKDKGQKLKCYKYYMMEALNFEQDIRQLKDDKTFIEQLFNKVLTLKSINSELEQEVSLKQLRLDHSNFKPGKTGFQQAKMHFEELIVS